MVSIEDSDSRAAALAPFDAPALNGEQSTIYALTDELRISFVNRAWTIFAEANGASWSAGRWDVGASIMGAIPAALTPFYQVLFATALRTREVVEHDYECSSATTLRLFRMRVMPCESGGLLVVHSLLRESPHEGPAGAAIDSLYRRADGMISVCSHCRRVRRVNAAAQWDWVPEYVARPAADTSHGLCPLCDAYYYPPETPS